MSRRSPQAATYSVDRRRGGARRLVAGAVVLPVVIGSAVTFADGPFPLTPVRPAGHTATQSPAAESSPRGRMAEFAIRNTVTGPDDRVTSRHSVLFHAGRVYDFDDTAPRFITIIDLAAGQVVLIDRQTQVKSSIATDKLLQAAARAEAAATDESQAIRFGVGTEVVESDDGQTFSTTYGDASTGTVRYDVTTAAVQDRLVPIAYGQFVDWVSRLDMARQAGPPPFARMAIHERVQSKGRIPSHTKVTVEQPNGLQEYSATHEMKPLTGNDELRIDEAAGMLVLYKEVPLSEFPR